MVGERENERERDNERDSTSLKREAREWTVNVYSIHPCTPRFQCYSATTLPVLLGDNVDVPSHINNIQGIKWYTEETTAGRHRELVSRRP